MTILIDTNVLLRSSDAKHTQHAAAVQALIGLANRGNALRTCNQVLVEFWSVATRPEINNGLAWPVDKAHLAIGRLRLAYPPVPDTDQIFTEWLDLVTRQAITGRQVFDARLVAAMRVHSIPAILTFNTQDFLRYPGIQVLNPAEVRG